MGMPFAPFTFDIQNTNTLIKEEYRKHFFFKSLSINISIKHNFIIAGYITRYKGRGSW